MTPVEKPTKKQVKNFSKHILEIRDELQKALTAIEELASKDEYYRNMEPFDDAFVAASNLRVKYWGLLVWEHKK